MVLHLQGSKSNTGSYSEWHRFLTYIGSEQRTEVSSLRTDLTAFCAENSVLSASHADRWMTASVFNAHATVSKQKASVTRRRYLSGAFDCSSESQFSSTVVPSKPMWLLSSSHGSDDHVLLCSQMLLCHDCGISAEESIMDSSHGVLFPFKDLISAAQDRRAFSSRAFDQIKDWSSADVLSTIRLRAFGSLFSSAVKIGSAYLALMLYISGDMQNDTANYLSLRNLVAHQALYGRNPSAALALRALLDFDNTLLNPLQRDLLNDLIVKISNFGALYNISMLSHKLDSNENTFFDKTSEALVVAGQSAGIDNLVAVQILRGQWVAAAKSNINLLALQRQAATESHLYVMLRSLMKMMQQLDQRLFSSSQSSILGEKEINNVLLLKGVKVSPEWYLTRGLWTIFLAIEKSSLASAFSALPSSAHHSSMHFQSYSCVQNLTQMTSCALSGLAVCHLMWQQLNEGSDMYFSLLERLLRQFSSDLHTKILVQQAVNGIRYAKDAKRLLFLLLSFELYDEAEKCCSRLTQLPNSKEFVGLAMAAVADRSASFRVALTKVLTQY